ncbi:MAG: N-acetylmuramoyl-L-alanine amidase [Alphaproteobacteria bacterium]|nr:MAG: N-acetylmuramoyl-L-alanine amidase [Alphaproteobacteria bacterium]
MGAMIRGVLILLAVLSGVPQALAQPSVKDVRIGVHPDKTRFVMELSEAPRYRVFTLPDPFRVVIDLPVLRWTPPGNLVRAGEGGIAAMRFGLFAPGTSRVVLDMTRPMRISNVFVIPPRAGYPYRFVVDLIPVTRAAFFVDGRQPFVSDPPLAPPQTRLPAPTKPSRDNRPTIVIDPGHGGVDPGARGLSGILEKKITLDYARELRRRLLATGRYRVVMTRDDDTFIRLRDRIKIAQEHQGDLFVSLHANNHKRHTIRGASVYTLSQTASDAEAEALAAKENKADIIAGIDLSEQPEEVSKILIDLARRETMNLSKHFANTLVAELGKVTKLLRNTHRFAGFAVLKSPTVPSVLLEIGYLSNPKEERLLRSAKHRARVIAAAVRAINEYFAWQRTLKRS